MILELPKSIPDSFINQCLFNLKVGYVVCQIMSKYSINNIFIKRGIDLFLFC
uniref:Uncharacterized protein n=1 Tax=Anguilla anguilla TaxID=7936 RepID=A0A0E9W1I1_ANGAN